MALISIVIPTYNRASILSHTLDSVAAQLYQGWECLVVDDHSIDNTKEIVENYCRKDSRFRYLVNEGKKGAQGARNTGLRYAQNDWVLFFDSDNIMYNDMLESIVGAIGEFKNQYEVFTCFSDVVNVHSGTKVGVFEWRCEGDIHEQLFAGECYVDYNGAVIRKKDLLEMGPLDEDCPSMQEWDTHIRLSKTARYHTIPKILVGYYVGGKDAISTDSNREVVGRLYILRKHRNEWEQHKESYIYFVKEIHDRIKQSHDVCFRISSVIKLVLYAPSVQWICLKRRIRRFIKKH